MLPATLQLPRIRNLSLWLETPPASRRSISDPAVQALRATDKDAVEALVRERKARLFKEMAEAEKAARTSCEVEAAFTALFRLRKRPIIDGEAPAWIKELLMEAVEMDQMALETQNLTIALRWASVDPEDVKW